MVRWSPSQVPRGDEQPMLLRLESDALQSSAFQTWLRSATRTDRSGARVDAKAPTSSFLLLLPLSVPIDSLRSVLAGSEDVVDFVLGDFASMTDERVIAYLTTEGILADTEVDALDASNDDRPPDVPDVPDVAPYLHPPYRLNDESYAQWFERLRQDPQERED